MAQKTNFMIGPQTQIKKTAHPSAHRWFTKLNVARVTQTHSQENYFERARFVDVFVERDDPDVRDFLAARLAVVAA